MFVGASLITRRMSSTDDCTRSVRSSPSNDCERCANDTVRPVTSRPAVGESAPESTRSNDVLPDPFTPTSPIRSPGPSCHVTRDSNEREPRTTSTSSSSSTVLPNRVVANFANPTESRGGGSSSISADAASRRNFGFDVRAGAPRRSQASSLRIRFCRRVSTVSASRIRSAFASTYAAYPPSYDATSPSATSHVCVQTASRNQRSWVTTTSASDRSTSVRASQSVTSMSRWFVGSSSNSRS